MVRKIKIDRFKTQVRAFTERSLRETIRNKMVIFWCFGFPLFWYILTFFLFIKPHTPTKYLDLAKATNAISFGIFGALDVSMVGFSIDMADDLVNKRYRLYRALPVSPLADFFGRFFGGFIFSLGSFSFIMIAGYIHGAKIALRGWAAIPIVFVSLLFLCLFCVGVGLIIARGANDPRYANGISLTIMMILFFITGYNGITPNMFPGKTWLINYIPNSLATRLITYYLLDVNSFEGSPLTNRGEIAMPHGPLFLLLFFAYAIVLLIIATLIMDESFYKGEAGE